MHPLFLALISLHALSGVFWAGSTLAMTHTSPEHKITPQLLRAQISAAALTIVAGAGLWGIAMRGAQGPVVNTLGIGALCAVVAVVVQGTMRNSRLLAQRIAAVLLSITVICMVISPYVT